MNEMDKLNHEIALLRFESRSLSTDSVRAREIQAEILSLQARLEEEKWN